MFWQFGNMTAIMYWSSKDGKTAERETWKVWFNADGIKWRTEKEKGDRMRIWTDGERIREMMVI